MVQEFLAGSLDSEDALAGASASETAGEQGGWSEDQLAIIESWKQSEEGKHYVNAVSKERIRKDALDVRKALEGDAKARENLSSGAKRFLRIFDEVSAGFQEQAQENLDRELARLVPATQEYNTALWEKSNDPDAFARRMSDARQRQFFGAMEDLVQKYGGRAGQQITQNRAQQIAKGQAQDSALESALEELWEDDDGLLTAEDKAAIADLAEDEDDPKVGLKKARKELTKRLAARQAESATRGIVDRATRVQEAGNGARAAAAAAPAAVSGRSGSPSARDPMAVVRAFNEDPGNPRAKADMEALAKAQGWKL